MKQPQQSRQPAEPQDPQAPASFAQHMYEINRLEELRSAAEVRAIRRATCWIMIFTGVIAVATATGILIAIFKNL